LLDIKVTVEVIGLPWRLSTAGETEQLVFGGPPEQLRLTLPVSPPIGVRVIVYTAWWPEEMVTDAGVAEIEKSPTLTCTEEEVELAMKFASPL
jgi:hypothetical protein